MTKNAQSIAPYRQLIIAQFKNFGSLDKWLNARF